ncbi:hypothetical protein R3X49_25025, partial [Salmonella enterica subsp. enterica serovar Weltevreden]|nr:hypothetical protein [Salmonella enterica subsp. enterica serovar Weltevreden]
MQHGLRYWQFFSTIKAPEKTGKLHLLHYLHGTDAVYNATRAALLAIFQHNKSAGEDRKITSVALPA